MKFFFVKVLNVKQTLTFSDGISNAFVTWSYHGSVTVLLTAGSCPDKDDLLSCPSSEKLGAISKHLWGCWTFSCVEFLIDTSESEGLVSCLRLVFLKITSLLPLLLSTGLGRTFFGILKLWGRGGVRQCIWCWGDDCADVCGTDVTLPKIEMTFFCTFEQLSEVECLAKVNVCFLVQGFFLSDHKLFFALCSSSWCFWHIFLSSSLFFCLEDSLELEEALPSSLVLTEVLSCSALGGSSALHFFVGTLYLCSLCSAETKLGVISCFFNLDGFLWEDSSFKLTLDVFSVFWIIVPVVLKGFEGSFSTLFLPLTVLLLPAI